ncbi:MAG: tetratricopeptide repeat protein [Polyangia bacterium]
MARILGVIGIVAALVACAPAHAGEPSALAVKAAKQHYVDGKKFQDAANYDAAIVEYEAAHKLAPKPVLLFNIGQCWRLKGDKQKAIDAYEAFLAAAPDDPVANDAREYVTTLKLRLEVERAEAASKRATEEAEIARKQIAEAEAARKRAEAEDADRRKRVLEEDARRRREDAAAAAAERQRQADEATAKQRRIADARNVGHQLRLAGVLTVVGGVVLFGASFFVALDASNQDDTIQNQPNHAWSASGDNAIQKIDTDASLIKALWGISIAAVVVGSGVAIGGAVQRSRAVERAQARLTPLVTPTFAGAALTGRF